MLSEIKDYCDRTFPNPGRKNPITIKDSSGLDITFDNFWHFQNSPIMLGNLKLAESLGITPFSLEDVLRVIDQTFLDNIVLHDTPGRGFRGNYLRVRAYLPETGFAKLSFCGIFGNYDLDGVGEVIAPLDLPSFTGFCIHYYDLEGRPEKLSDIVAHLEYFGKYPLNLHYGGEVQYSSVGGVPTQVSSDPII
jgi:hypothetical protein